MNRNFGHWISVALIIVGLGGALNADAVQLDWNGQFWFDQEWLNNYQLDRSRPGDDRDPELSTNGGAYVPGAGEKNVVWYAAFFKLKPRLVVNDSIYIKSELHLGSPLYGFYGRGYPASGDERLNFTGSQKDSFTVGAQRFWANLVTDFGTIELGRAPRHWALGALWNSGDNLFERYQSTGDMVRLTSKFGNFSISPAIIKVAMGNNAGGASVGGNIVHGSDDITDYEFAVKYDNSEEDFDFGMMWTKRTGTTSQTSLFFNPNGRGSTRVSFNMFDFYAKKKWGRFFFGGELPLFNGSLGALDGINEFEYKTLALIFEGGYTSDLWDVNMKAGHVPGQPPTNPGDTKFRAVFLNKNYKLGLIMFNYNLYGLAFNNPDTIAAGSLNSPYDNQIVNANYFAINPQYKLDKWTIRSTFVLAYASNTARAGQQVYNYNQRQYKPAVDNQSSFLGKEADLGVSFKWDENFTLSWDFGAWWPGNYYAFSNDATRTTPVLARDMMFASQVRVGVTF